MLECQTKTKLATELQGNETKVTAEDLSEEMKITVLPVTILIGIEACLGIAGNIFILLIYSLRYRRCNFKYFVLCMSLIDLISCLTTLPGEIYSQLYWYSYKYEWICKTKSYFNVFVVWNSALALLLLAYDRYRKICRPLDWQLKPSWALRLCVISITVSALISAPVAVLWGKQTYIYKQKYQNITVTICEKSGNYIDGNLPFLFITFAYMTPVAIIIIIIYVLNFKIAQAIFLSIPETQRKISVHCRRNNDSGNPLGYVSDVHNNPCIENEISLENISSHSDRKLEETLDTTTEIKQHFDTQPSTKLTNTYSGVREPTGDFDAHALIFEQNDRNKRYNCKRKRLSSCCSDTSGYVSLHRLKLSRLSTSSNTSQGRASSRMAKRRYSTGETHLTCHTEGRASRLKHKTEIMLVLTTVFTITIIIYLVLISFVASEHNILRRLKENEKVIFFFFWRFYFINVLINPLLYGLMDPRFRKGVKEIFCTGSLVRRRRTKSQVIAM